MIYTGKDKCELGVLQAYSFDMAYGSSENDFALEMPRTNDVLETGSLIYIENDIDGIVNGTEYGGVIDSITTDTKNEIVTYEGRSWHGIMAAFVIQPEDGEDYYEVDGDFNYVCQELIDYVGLGDIFYCEEKESGIDINNYRFERYTDLYTGLKAMLSQDGVNAKLKLVMNPKTMKVKVYAELIDDYSVDEEFDNDKIQFVAKMNYRSVNHLICLGQGELQDRAVIHLFLDEDNNLMPYATTNEPLEATDYILDKSMQQLFGIDEVAETYDYPSAEVIDNYIMLETEPDNWNTACDQYYKLSDSGNSTEFSSVDFETYEYALLEQEPDDWNQCYENYYVINDDSYDNVEGEDEDQWEKVTIQPSDWEKKYSDYYYHDEGEYKGIDGVKTYSLLEEKPDDFDDEYKNYYEKDGDSYKEVDIENKVYNLMTSIDAPSSWSRRYSQYYTYEDGEYKNVTANETYTLTKSKPDDWTKNYTQYYTTDGTTYTKVKGVAANAYYMQSVKPSDWNTKYTKYYTYKKSTKKYIQIPSNETDQWHTITQKPSKWSSTYKNYYVRTWNGVEIVYTQISTTTKYTYKKQTSSKAPSDWEDNYSSYYCIKDKKYKAVEGVKEKDASGKEKTVAPKWKKNMYYTRYSEQKVPNFTTKLNESYGKKIAYKTTKDGAPKWKANTYYTFELKSKKAPTWVSGTYYSKTESVPKYTANTYYKLNTDTVPQWESDRYYEYTGEEAPPFEDDIVWKHITQKAPTWEENKYYYSHNWTKAPDWQDDVFYRLAKDYYKTIVDGGIDKLNEYINSDSIDVTDNLNGDYDIGDIVGANDNITGISVWQPITKKIIKITNGSITLSYEIGG